jgi:hypothetical protein
MMAYTDRREVG